MSATYPMDMVRGRITVQVLFSFIFILPNTCFACYGLELELELEW